MKKLLKTQLDEYQLTYNFTWEWGMMSHNPLWVPLCITLGLKKILIFFFHLGINQPFLARQINLEGWRDSPMDRYGSHLMVTQPYTLPNANSNPFLEP